MLLCVCENPIKDFSSPLREHSRGAASRMWFIIPEINRLKHVAQLGITCFKEEILNKLQEPFTSKVFKSFQCLFLSL